MQPLPALAAAIALFSVGACGQPPPAMQTPSPPPAAPAPVGECNTDAAQFAVGKVLDAALTEQVRARAGAQRVRVVRPGQMVTMDFDERRLTLELDAAERVVKARCG